MSENNEPLSTFHQGQIINSGLILVREDICEWIRTLLTHSTITGNTFLSSLHSGVLFCDIIVRLYQLIPPIKIPMNWPKTIPKADREAAPQSFKARDNVCLFLSWCRAAGLRNTILFETNGLMNNYEEKNVVLTLLHVGEMCLDLGIPVPQFANLKKEIDIAQHCYDQYNSVYILTNYCKIGSTDSGFNSARSTMSMNWNDKNIMTSSLIQHSTSKTEIDSTLSLKKDLRYLTFPQSNIRKLKSVSSKTKRRSRSINDLGVVPHSYGDNLSKLDVKVSDISKRCCCETIFNIERTKMHEGMYTIGSKNIFIRMFKGNIMLRVGGGWETLNEYLDKVHPSCYNLPSRDMIPEIISSQELKNLSERELTKVKKIIANEC